MEDNPYLPAPAVITDVYQEYSKIKTFTIRFEEEEIQNQFEFNPGQFVQVSIPGVGEAPISINSSPTLRDRIRLCVEKKGRVTSSLFKMGRGSRIMIRGPFGNGYPIHEARGKEVLFVGGGIGLAPLASAIEYIMGYRGEYGKVQIMYGDKTPTCLLFNRHFSRWEEYSDLYVICEETGPEWPGEKGMVTDLLDEVDLDLNNAVAFSCGPPVMYKFVVPKLQEVGFKDEDIYLSLERRMECGFGKCRRCNIGDIFVCKDGPVFAYEEIKEYRDMET